MLNKNYLSCSLTHCSESAKFSLLKKPLILFDFDVLCPVQFEEQQTFERSRRFLRQLEISFGENLSHYQKIVRALQGGPGLSPASIEEVCHYSTQFTLVVSTLNQC